LVGWPSTGWEVAGLLVAFAAVMWLTLGGVGITFVVSQVFDLGWRLPSNETGAFVAGDRAWYLDLVSFIYSDLGCPGYAADLESFTHGAKEDHRR
jgi:hypothetical protein